MPGERKDHSISPSLRASSPIWASVACEQALLFGRVKRVSRERASERRSQYSKYSLRARHRRSSLYRFQSNKKVVINTCSLRVRFYTQFLKMCMYFFTRVLCVYFSRNLSAIWWIYMQETCV